MNSWVELLLHEKTVITPYFSLNIPYFNFFTPYLKNSLPDIKKK